MEEALLIIAASERDADLYFATRFLAPDPFPFFQIGRERVILVSDLELGRAKSQAAVDTVLSLQKYEDRAKNRVTHPGLLDAVDEALRERGVRGLVVSGSFPVEYADKLRAKGYEVRVKEGIFFEERLVKSGTEVAWIAETLRLTEEAMQIAIDALREAEIRGNALYRGGEPLTSEGLRRLIHHALLDRDCTAERTIVAGGEQGSDPHEEGTGPLMAHQPIVIDIFPRSTRTRYFADITRTVVKGKASQRVARMHEAVLQAQERAVSLIRDGADGSATHHEVTLVFERLAFPTGEVDGRMQGFFHGTGHGLGLEIHEPPRISKRGAILRTGNVVTVEPGLYYSGEGGVRIEDIVVVTETGCQTLTRFHKLLEV
ncbi:MAG: M24 family metallopeptidase [Candidatus Methylomirabilales bacterium]